jgi:RND family efflux transporter MFP subunit
MHQVMKIVLPVAIVVGSLLIAAVLVSSRPKVETRAPTIPPPLVRVMAAETDTVQLTVFSQGAVMPRTESELSSEVDGQVVYVSPAFASGGFFEKGALLVQLDQRNGELAVVRAAADTSRDATVYSIEAEEARVAIQEWASLGQGKPNALVSRQPQLAQARASLDASRAALRQAELNLERTEIRAPFAGRVRQKRVDVGQYVNRGNQVATIYAVDFAEVRLPVPDEQLAYFEAPMHFRGERSSSSGTDITLNARFAGEQHQWTGKLVRLEGEIDPQSRMVTAVARIPNPYGRGNDPNRPPLSVGMFVEAEIKGHQFADVFVVPRAAMRGYDQVLIIDADERLRFRTVDVLRLEPNRALIKGGIQAGERICLSALDTPVDGMMVRVFQEEPTDQTVQEGAAH